MSRPPRLPLRITLLLWLVLIITALSGIRLFTALAWQATLDAYVPPAVVTYVAFSGAVWMLVGLVVLWSFWFGKRYTRAAFLIAAGCYSGWVWVDRLAFQTELGANWLFALILTVVLLAFTVFVVLDPRNQIYFRKETYGPKPESQQSS